MSNNFNFNQLPEISSTWFKFSKPRVTYTDGKILQQGDTLSGTLAGVRRNVVTKEGIAPQTIFDVLVSKGTELIIEGQKVIAPKDETYMYSDRKKPFLAQMDRINLGQYVKLEFVELRDVGQIQPAKIIQPFSSSKFINEEWIKENEARLQQDAQQKDIDAELDQITIPNAPQMKMEMQDQSVEINEEDVPFVTDEEVRERLIKVNILAIQKLGIVDPNQIKTEVKRVTGIDFTDLNLNKIIKVLEGLPDKK